MPGVLALDPARVDCHCVVCGMAFWRYRSHPTIRSGGRVYCGQSCRNIGRRGDGNPKWRGGRVERKCELCGAAFLADPDQVRIGRAKFCSVECKANSQKGLRGPKPGRLKPCEACGDLFNPIANLRQRFCCRGCYMAVAKTAMTSEERYKKIAPKIRRLERLKQAIATHGHHSRQQWRNLVELHKGQCAHCKQRTKLTRDHIVPLSAGGSDLITNIQPLCASCNARKKNKRTQLL